MLYGFHTERSVGSKKVDPRDAEVLSRASSLEINDGDVVEEGLVDPELMDSTPHFPTENYSCQGARKDWHGPRLVSRQKVEGYSHIGDDSRPDSQDDIAAKFLAAHGISYRTI